MSTMQRRGVLAVLDRELHYLGLAHRTSREVVSTHLSWLCGVAMPIWLRPHRTRPRGQSGHELGLDLILDNLERWLLLGRRTAPAARQPQPAAPPAVADHRDDGLREVRAAGRGERIPPVPVENEEQVPGRRVPV